MGNCSCKTHGNYCDSTRVCTTPPWLEDCGCPTKLSTLCVIYQGVSLEYLGIQNGDRLEYVLSTLNQRFKRMIDKIDEGFLVSNVGDGAEVFKGAKEDGGSDMRTLKGSESVEVKESEDTIDFKVKDDWLANNSVIRNIKSDITNISDSVQSSVNSKKTKSFTTIGSKVIDLPQTPSSVLMVTYCGSVLPPNGYSVNGDVVTLQLGQFGLTIEENDSVTVIFNP